MPKWRNWGFSDAPETIFRIGTWRSDDWAVCAFCVDGSRLQLNRVEEMFRQKYGISGEGELSWTLGIKVKRDREAHIVSISQESYIDNLLDRFGLIRHRKGGRLATGLLNDFGINLRVPMVIFGDNQGAIALTQNPVFHP